MEIINVTQHDEAALLNIATEAIQDQITPILTELGRGYVRLVESVTQSTTQL